VRDRVVVGVRCKGLLTGESGVADKPFRPEHSLGLGEVVRQLGGVRPRLVAVQRLERLGDPGVEADTTRRRQLRQQRLLKECMREAVTADRAGRLHDDPGRERLFSDGEQLLLGRLDEWRQLIEPKLSTDDRGESQDGIAPL
jgi:hypothetical protein